uniref:DUF281 domain-containing protein n=1 Tax=Caenorhabditis tropicalis TaxID=1561998 RepID=A0A1I7V4C1_9PELO
MNVRTNDNCFGALDCAKPESSFIVSTVITGLSDGRVFNFTSSTASFPNITCDNNDMWNLYDTTIQFAGCFMVYPN